MTQINLTLHVPNWLIERAEVNFGITLPTKQMKKLTLPHLTEWKHCYKSWGNTSNLSKHLSLAYPRLFKLKDPQGSASINWFNLVFSGLDNKDCPMAGASMTNALDCHCPEWANAESSRKFIICMFLSPANLNIQAQEDGPNAMIGCHTRMSTFTQRLRRHHTSSHC